MAQKYPGSKAYLNANSTVVEFDSTVVEFGMALQNYRKFSHKRTNKK